jgi:hypothetical protein
MGETRCMKNARSSVVDPDQNERWIRIRIKVISWIRIRINLQMTSQNERNMSLFKHFFKFLAFIWKLGSKSASKWQAGAGSASNNAVRNTGDLSPVHFSKAGSRTLPDGPDLCQLAGSCSAHLQSTEKGTDEDSQHSIYKYSWKAQKI